MAIKPLFLACALCVGISPVAMAAGTPSSAVTAQQAGAIAGPKLPRLTAEDIVRRNAGARGGADAWAKIRAVSYTGKLDAGRERRDGGHFATDARIARVQARLDIRKRLANPEEAETGKVIQLPYRLDMQRPGRTRLEVNFAGDTAVQVYDGHQGWKLRPYLGRREVEAFTAQEALVASQQQELDGPLMNYAAKGNRIALDGTDRVENRDAYRLKVSLKSGAERKVWIDAQTFLELRIDAEPRRVDGAMRQVYTYYRDWRPEQGLQMPHTLETRVEGQHDAERIYIDQVAFNPELEANRFSQPQ